MHGGSQRPWVAHSAPKTLQTLPVFYFALRNDLNCNSVFVINHQGQFELKGFSKFDFVHVKGSVCVRSMTHRKSFILHLFAVI